MHAEQIRWIVFVGASDCATDRSHYMFCDDSATDSRFVSVLESWFARQGVIVFHVLTVPSCCKWDLFSIRVPNLSDAAVKTDHPARFCGRCCAAD